MTDHTPELDAAAWLRTEPALHQIAQIVGKVALATHPFRNHWWETGLRVTPRGLRTTLLRAPTTDERFELELDLVDARLELRSTGGATTIALDGALTVAEVYHQVINLPQLEGAHVHPLTCEMTPAVRLDESAVAADLRDAVVAAWLAQLHPVQSAYDEVLTDVVAKAEGGLLFWGALDFALVIFNGQPNTPPSDADEVYRLSENAENISFSYWIDAQGKAELCAYRTPSASADATSDFGYGVWTRGRGEVVCALTPTGQIHGAPHGAELVPFIRATMRTLAGNGGWDYDALLGQTPEPRRDTP